MSTTIFKGVLFVAILLGIFAFSPSEAKAQEDDGCRPDDTCVCHHPSKDSNDHVSDNTVRLTPGHQRHVEEGRDHLSCDMTEPGAVPEPITMLLFGAGLAGIGYAAKRRRAKSE